MAMAMAMATRQRMGMRRVHEGEVLFAPHLDTVEAGQPAITLDLPLLT